jgi:NADH-quinone oxidoreductase subunit J
MQLVIFFILAVITVIAGIIMVSADNIARSIYSHVLALLCIAGIYILLYAEFMAGVQVLIYAGGVSIMLLFALMLTKPAKGIVRALDHPVKFPAFVVSITLFSLMVFGIVKTKWPFQNVPSEVMTADTIGKVMFVRYVLPFEIVSVILLVALIGAVIIGGQKDEKRSEGKKEP